MSLKTIGIIQLVLPPLHHAQSHASKHAIKYTSDSTLNLFQIVIFFTRKLRFGPRKQPEVPGDQVWGIGCVLKHFDTSRSNKGQSEITIMARMAVIFLPSFSFLPILRQKLGKMNEFFALKSTQMKCL